MCGIFGMVSMRNGVSTWPQHYQDIMEQGLYVTGLRGLDSTGIFTVHESKAQEVFMFKGPIDPMQLCSGKPYSKFVSKHFPSARYIIGHTRKATRGDISWDNSHPFSYKGITLVHNGNLSNTYDFKNMQYDVDSQYIPQILSESESVADALSKMSGAFALVWYDAKDKSLNIARNGERSLWFYVHKTSDRLFLASERDILFLILGRNGINPEYNDIQPFLPHNHYVIKEGSGFGVDFTFSEAKFKETSVTNVYYGHGNWVNQNQRNNYTPPARTPYKPRAWSNIIPRVPISHEDNIPMKEIVIRQGIGNPDRVRVFAVGTVETIAHGKTDVDVELFNVHKRFGEWIALWVAKYNEGEFGISARPYALTYERDVINTSKAINLDPNSLEGWRLKNGSRVYYSFKNTDGTYRKLGIKEDHKRPILSLVHSPEKSTIITPEDLFPGPGNTLLDAGAFLAATQDGCVSCKQPITEKDVVDMTWRDDKPICGVCTEFVKSFGESAYD